MVDGGPADGVAQAAGGAACEQPLDGRQAAARARQVQRRASALPDHVDGLAVTELLNSSEPLREGVIQKLQTSKLLDIAIEHGMTSLWQNGMAKVQRGITSLDEVIRVITVNQL